MPEGNFTVVISAGQSRNPEKRELEGSVASLAAALPGVNVLRVPHLYDLARNGDTYQALKAVQTDLFVITWLFDRAAHWILDRNGVRGQVGEVELKQDLGDDEDDEVPDQDSSEQRVIDSQPRPARYIYCVDFRASNSAQAFVDEMHRVRSTTEAPVGPRESPGVSAEQLERFANPQNDTFVGSSPSPASGPAALPTLFGASSVVAIEEHPSRRWYPVIDFSRCTNCMECIDFCLFGVYGVDSVDTILVDQPDNCRKGCPACSRVCPQNAIMFPQHKTPAIAGAPVDSAGMKIDLSKLFGAPESDEDAATLAARERDEQLILAGRDPLGADSGLSQRLAEQASVAKPHDDLDDLLDQLDSLDL